MRVLVSTTPLDGHVRPLLPLAHALREAGHELAFATERSWHPHIEDAGFEALAAGPRHDDAWTHTLAALGDELGDALEHRANDVFAILFGEGHANHKARSLRSVAERWGADVLVHESADLAGPAVAAALDVPVVHHSWGPMLPLDWFEAAASRVAPAWGDRPPPPYAGAFQGLYIDLAPRGFVRETPPGQAIPMRPASPQSGASWVGELPAPLVYVTLGTLFNDPRLQRTIVDALSERSGSAVITTGRDVDPDALGAVPAHIHVRRFVAQSEVLPHAVATVCHGGAGSTLGALAHGVPLVLIPMGADQFHIAGAARDAGAAVVLRRADVTAEVVAAALDTLRDEGSYAAAARQVQGVFAEMPDPTAVALEVERYVRQRRP